MKLPKGRIPHDTLDYCVGKPEGNIKPILDELGSKLIQIKLGDKVFQRE